MRFLALLFGTIAAFFAIGFVIMFIRFERNYYNCVDGIRMIFFGISSFGHANLAAALWLGGRK